MKWILNTYKFWYKLYKEIRTLWIFRKTAHKNTELLNDKDLRVDWIGRIYTVVNLPEKVSGASKEVHQAYVLQHITKFGDLMLKIGLADVIYPEIKYIEGKGAYLVILWPVFEKLQLFTIMVALLRTVFVTGILYFLYRVIANYIDFIPIYEWIVNQF